MPEPAAQQPGIAWSEAERRELERVRQSIARRGFAPARKAALLALLDGRSYRWVARRLGADFRQLARDAASVEGLRELHRLAWRRAWGESWPALWDHHLAPTRRERAMETDGSRRPDPARPAPGVEDALPRDVLETAPRPPAGVPEREARVAEGVALIHAGHSERFAAEAVGIPRSTLHRAYVRLLGPDAPNRDQERQRADERILAGAYALTEETVSRMVDAVAEGRADHRTLTAWSEVGARVIGRLRGWERGIGSSSAGEKITEVIERLAEQGGARLTFSVQPLEREAEEE